MTRSNLPEPAVSWLPNVGGAFLFGCLVWLVLPATVVTYDDDFAYLRSVVETIQRGRPWTYEWLTPWAASLSGIVALLFKGTGSFSFAVHFSLSLAGAMAYFGLCSVLRNQGLRGWRAPLLCGLLLLLPSVFFMHLMFTSVALYMGCLWLCAWLGMERKWGWFFLFWCIGISSRQSAITWLALPGWIVIADLWQHRQIRFREAGVLRPLLVIAAGAVTLLVLMMGMNKTSGQQTTFGSLSSFLAWERLWLPVTLGAGALLAGLGLGGMATALRPTTPKMNWGRKRWVFVFVATSIGILAGLGFREVVSATHSSYRDDISNLYFAVLGGIAGLGLTFIKVRPRWEFLFVGLGTFALLLIYGGTFDYYYNDLIFWGFLATLAPGVGLPKEDVSLFTFKPIMKMVILVALAFLMGVNFRWLVRFRYEGDRAAGVIRLFETALRSGKMTPDLIGQDTFGHCGWLLEDYHRDHDGGPNYSLGDFMLYTQSWDGKAGTGVETETTKKLRKLREWLPTHNTTNLIKTKGKSILHQMESTVLWGKYNVRYSIVRVEPKDANATTRRPLLAEEYKLNPFPLDDSEWRAYIAKQPFGQPSKQKAR